MDSKLTHFTPLINKNCSQCFAHFILLNFLHLWLHYKWMRITLALGEVQISVEFRHFSQRKISVAPDRRDGRALWNSGRKCTSVYCYYWTITWYKIRNLPNTTFWCSRNNPLPSPGPLSEFIPDSDIVIIIEKKKRSKVHINKNVFNTF